MKTKNWILFLFILLLGLTAGAISMGEEIAYVEPGLTNSETPTQSVIITAIDSRTAFKAVAEVGGQVTGDLWLIDGVAANVPSQEIKRLARFPGIHTIVNNKLVFAAGSFPVDTPYAWDGWATDRRGRLYASDVEFSGTLGSLPVVLPDGGVFVVTESGQALILNEDGTVRSTLVLPDPPFDDPPVVGPDGVIYINARKSLYAIYPDGTSSWDYTSELKFEGGLAVYETGNLVYAVTRDELEHFFMGFNATDGEVIFNTPIDGDNEELFLCPPTVDQNGFAYFIAKTGVLYKVNSAGEVEWMETLVGANPSKLSPQVGPDGTVYVPSEEGLVTAVNPEDGTTVYTFHKENGIILEPLAIASDGSVYGGFGDSHIYGIDPEGNEKFDYFLSDHQFNYSPILTLDETQLIVAAQENKVLSLEAETGTLNWQFNPYANAEIMDNPVLAPNGQIHFGDFQGNYYILNPEGLVLFSIDKYTKFINSPTLNQNGTVFIHDNESYLVTLTRLAEEWDGISPDVQPTTDPMFYQVLNPINIDMGTDILHENGIDGDGVTVAVVDSGVYFDDETQQLLGGVVQEHFLGQVDYVIDENTCLTIGGMWEAIEGYCETDETNSQDTFGHGSHVAGIIWNHIADYTTDVTLGVAPEANILSVRVLSDHGGGTYADVIQGIQYIVANKTTYSPEIRVLNLSLTANPSTPYFADPLNIAVEKAWAAGIVVLAAAGNTGPEAETITVPGNNPYVITVGAVNSNRTPGYWFDDMVAPWSATGPTYDGFFKPDVLAPGMNVVSFMYNGAGEIPYLVEIHPDYSENTSLFRMNGTSMATAAVSGAVALMLDHDPSLTPDQVKFRLLYTAQQTMNEYGEVVNNIFQQGAGRIWMPAAIYGDLPPDGQANAGMDILEDLSHGWETEEDIVFHYEGPISKVLSDDGSVYLYYVDAGDGTAMALGAAELSSGQWLSADELDDLAAVLPGGQMVWAGGQMVWAGGQIVWAGRPASILTGVTSHDMDDDLIWIEGELVWSGSQVEWLGGQMVWEEGQVYWDGGYINSSNTFTYSDDWVNDDGTVEKLPAYEIIYLPLLTR